MSWQSLAPSDDVEGVDWIRDRLHPFAAYDVGSVIPAGFAAYARIFHPASTSRDWNPDEVRWSDVAAWNGRTVHPEMQFHAIATPSTPRYDGGPQPWSGEPRLGVLSRGQARALIDVLGRVTEAPDACWFCIWDGYGYFNKGATVQLTSSREGPATASVRRPPRWHLRTPFPKPMGNLPDRKRVQFPQRHYLLFKGNLSKAEGWEDGPNLWWPDDRKWCVASEIDHPYSYVGGTAELIGEILQHSAIEALPAGLDQDITAAGDKINA